MSSDSKIKITSDHCDTSDSDDLENENDQYRSYFLQGKSELDKIIGKYDEYSDDEILEDKPEVDAIFHDILENIGDDTLIYPLGEILSTVSPYALVNPHEMKFVLDSGTRVISWKDGKIIGLIWDVIGPIDNYKYCVLMRPGLEELFTCGEKLRFCKNSAHFVNVESLKAFSGIDVDSDGVEEFSNDEDERIYKKGLESGEIRQKK